MNFGMRGLGMGLLLALVALGCEAPTDTEPNNPKTTIISAADESPSATEAVLDESADLSTLSGALGGGGGGTCIDLNAVHPCCWPDYSCTMEDYYTCGGQWFPTVNDCTQLSTMDLCKPTWACCLPDGTCTIMNQAECEFQGGTYHPYQTCDEIDCVGACCDPAAGCSDGIPPNQCTAPGANFVLGGDCATIGDCDNGACCEPGGGCTEGPQSACNGTYYPGQTCQDINDCDPDPEGACCIENVGCNEGPQSACPPVIGTFYPGQSCQAIGWCGFEETGACCEEDGGCIDGIDQSQCNGFFYMNQTCADVNDCGAEPEVGACCLDDGSCIENVPAEKCDATQFYPNQTCAQINFCKATPALGACCLPDGTCVDGVSAKKCDLLGGQFTPNATCADVDCCPEPKLEACCVEGVCVDVELWMCKKLHGIPQPGVQCDQAKPCCETSEPPVGACCLPDFSCITATQAQCDSLGGAYGGDNSICQGGEFCQSIIPGPCCLPDGTCSMMPWPACHAAGGWNSPYPGDCSTPNICVPVVNPGYGACCLKDGSCVSQSPQTCAALGGNHLGAGALCVTGICN